MGAREWFVRLIGSLRRRRRDEDLEEELRLHVQLAAEDAERRGASRADASRAARLRNGGTPQALDALRDQRGLPWLDALRSDLVFGARQLVTHRTATIAAVLSLGLAIGATTAAFRLVDAVLLRPLPVEDPHRLFAVAATFVDAGNRPDYREYFDYPTFREYVKTAGPSAELMVVGMTHRPAIRFRIGDEPEAAYRQFVSGNLFTAFGLQPAAGRLLSPADDRRPGGHPVAVISYDYWTRRFGRDASAVGATFLVGRVRFEIVGVTPRGFTGTEPGYAADFFVPAMMNAAALDARGWSWFRIWLRPAAGVAPEEVRQRLQAVFRARHEEQAARFPRDTKKELIDAFLAEEIRLLPASSGVSSVQKDFRRPLLILMALAALVLAAACVNVANLVAARGAARGRELALRLSLGATRRRIVQLMLVESALLAASASAAGTVLAQWSAPLVVSMLGSAEQPIRLSLGMDVRALSFGILLALAVTLLFGALPALRASSVPPAGSLKGDSAARDVRMASVFIAGQVAFCVFLVFAAGLFVRTFDRLLSRPLGFEAEDLLLMEVETRGDQPPSFWAPILERVRAVPGVRAAALAGWAPLTGNRWRSTVRVEGRQPAPGSPHFVSVSSGYFATMGIGMTSGRDFRSGEGPPRLDDRQRPLAGVGIVNGAFARAYFDDRDPVGRIVHVSVAREAAVPMQIVGVVRDAVYFDVRERTPPTVYVPMDAADGVTILVRASGDERASAAALRGELQRASAQIGVPSVTPQAALVRRQMVRERVLAALSAVFAVVALVLAGVGLYAMLNQSVVRRRREIGIRMALGASAPRIVARIAVHISIVTGAGALVGTAGGVLFGRGVEALLFDVRPTDPAALAAPAALFALTALLAAIPPAVRAVGIDPAMTLRSE